VVTLVRLRARACPVSVFRSDSAVTNVTGMRTALVLGGGGFIGSHLVRRLKQEGYFVRAVDLDVVTGATFELGGPDIVSWNEFWERLKRARRSRRPSIHVPVLLMRLNALVTERLPGDIPLTNDLLTMLEHGDNVVSDTTAVETFALPLVPLDEQLRRAA